MSSNNKITDTPHEDDSDMNQTDAVVNKDALPPESYEENKDGSEV